MGLLRYDLSEVTNLFGAPGNTAVASVPEPGTWVIGGLAFLFCVQRFCRARRA